VAGVTFTGVTKRFGEVLAVDHLDLEIADREFLVLLGPSGCGKSTVLRMIAGLERPTEGTISIGDQVVNDVMPKERDVAMVFQSYALYPHKTTFQNIEFPLKTRKVPKPDRRESVERAAGLLGLSELLGRKPGAMSGGQRQRVALARAIVREPAVFLMDEPLSNLDAKLRSETRAELIALHARLAATIVYVTHDQVEAMTMGQRVAVMSNGLLQQLGRPQDVYDRPANVFVAQFIGTPPMNVFPPGVLEPGDVRVGVRPEHLVVSGDGTVTGTVKLVEELGHERHVTCVLADGSKVIARVPAEQPAPLEGDEVRLGAADRHRHRFDATTGERRSA
jgi:multiple sugar transport system ATP-binding protein